MDTRNNNNYLMRIQELENENFELKKTIETSKFDITQNTINNESFIDQRTLDLNKMNSDLHTAKFELEQYKIHLEEVIKERTLELKNSELRFLSLSDSLKGGAIFEITLTKSDIPWIGYLSKTTKALLDIDMIDIQNNLQFLYNRIHPDDLRLFQTAFAKSKHSKCEFEVEVRYLSPKNALKWLLFRANAIEQAENYTVWVGIIIDTTEKNKYQLEIQEREAILNAIIENIPYDFWARDSDLNCFLQNSASKKLWGDMIGKNPEEIPIPQNEQQYISNQISRVIQGEVINEETKLEDIHGIVYEFQTLLAPILLNDKTKGVLGFNIDITNRKQVEKALIQNEEKFRNIFDSSTDAIIIHTKTGEIIEMNKEFKKLLEYPTSHSYLNISNFLNKKDCTQFWSNIEEICGLNEIYLFETEFKTHTDKNIPIEIKSKEIDYLGSKAILSLIQNTTYRKKFERDLVNAIIETEEKERARIAADLHDEIGPILSCMKMLTGLLIDTKEIEKTKKISQQILELVSESIHSVREISNSLSPHILKNYGIIAAIRKILQSFEHSLKISIKTNCENIRFESTTEIIYYRVMRELLNNTIKHANAKNIEIILLYENNKLLLKYKDNGVGFNVDEKIKDSKTGMGLYNILNRIKSLEANYSLSSNIGQGTIFILETKLPTLNL